MNGRLRSVMIRGVLCLIAALAVVIAADKMASTIDPAYLVPGIVGLVLGWRALRWYNAVLRPYPLPPPQP